MSRWLRHHRYALQVALRRLMAQPFSTLANILVISLTLSVPLIAASVLVSAQPVVRQIPVSPEVTLFLHNQLTIKQAEDLSTTLQKQYADDILEIRVVDKDQALRALKSNPDWDLALSALPGNPLPDALVITLSDSSNLATRAAELAEEWRTNELVNAVQLDSTWVRRLEAILQFLRASLGLLSLGVALVVLATVFNTVRMQALTQRDEIAVARLVGATESFVRRPFLYLGALTGVLASLLALGLAAMALQPLNAALATVASSYGTQIALQLPDAVSLALSVVTVAILAALSARWSVTRNA